MKLRSTSFPSNSAGCVWASGKVVLAALVLLPGSIAVQGAEKLVIGDKTLVAWVAPANLAQRGGSVLTLEKAGGTFDAIVFGEKVASRWMAGSNNFSRTQAAQESSPPETSAVHPLVQIAIVYKAKQVTIYRDGEKYANYSVASPEQFNDDSLVLMGLRHTGANPDNRFFVGSIDDARIYGVALSGEQIRALRPNQPSEPRPLAWWDFESGRAADRMKQYSISTLFGEARLADGRLYLNKPGDYLMATRTTPQAAVDYSNVNGATPRAEGKVAQRSLPAWLSLRDAGGSLHAVRPQRGDLLEGPVPPLLHFPGRARP